MSAADDRHALLEEKLEFLQRELAKTASASEKFHILKEIEEAEEALGRTALSATSVYWNVPHANASFTGREDFLAALHEALTGGGSMGQVISGLGGIGKTQAAIQYAHRYREDYEAVFWVRSGTESEIRAGLVEVARLLALPGAEEDEARAIGAVRRWLATHDGWLLIFDDVEEPGLLAAYLPSDVRGRLLLTSRARDFAELGLGTPMRIPVLTPEEGQRFLLRRTGRESAPPAEQEAALGLARELDGLPLALEQAAAYLTDCETSFSVYLEGYGKRRLALLEEERPKAGKYPLSVETTWSMNIDEVPQDAQDLLRACSFLAPDAIPLELFTDQDGNADSLAVDTSLRPLLRYSLLARGGDTVSVHRLVQLVVRKHLEEAFWSGRVAERLNEAFPAPEYEAWNACERLAPHVRAAALSLPATRETAQLLNKAGSYALDRGRFADAEEFLERSLEIREALMDEPDVELAIGLANLGSLLAQRGPSPRAEDLLLRAQRILEEELGPEDVKLGRVLNSLAVLRYHANRYVEAEELYLRSLTIHEKAFGPDSRQMTRPSNDLANVYLEQGRLDEASALQERALAIWEGIEAAHPGVSDSAFGLGVVRWRQGRLDEAEALLRRALEIRVEAFGNTHPKTCGVREALERLSGVSES